MPDQLTLHNGIPDHDRFCDCLDCRTAWEDWHEAKYRDRLAARDPERVGGAKPANDAEWAAFLDAEWPRVKEGATT